MKKIMVMLMIGIMLTGCSAPAVNNKNAVKEEKPETDETATVSESSAEADISDASGSDNPASETETSGDGENETETGDIYSIEYEDALAGGPMTSYKVKYDDSTKKLYFGYHEVNNGLLVPGEPVSEPVSDVEVGFGELTLEDDVTELVAECFRAGAADSSYYLQGKLCENIRYYMKYVEPDRDKEIKDYYEHFPERDLNGDGIITKIEDFTAMMENLRSDIAEDVSENLQN